VHFTFWEQLALNVAGPLMAVAFGTVVVRWLTDRIARRRASMELRQRLAFEMTEAAYALYFGLVHHQRQVNHGGLSSYAKVQARKALDVEYVRQRVAMGALQARLDVYFDQGTEPSGDWHRVIDLLTVLHFTVVGAPPRQLEETRRSVSGPEHSGLSDEDLADAQRVIQAFGKALRKAATSVLDRRSTMSSVEKFLP
jgi:hypothetical protein